MKVSSLIIESKNKTKTGLSFVDTLVESVGSNFQTTGDLPISASSSDWITLESPERLSKTFSFSTTSKLRYFINEVLSYQDKIKHHALVVVLGNDITIESYTHDVNAVTNQDLKLARFADEIYEDTRFFSR